ncbi:MAG: hypothetical protein ACRC63_01220 [Metamycoplasmataceae bacterium]
MENKTYTQEDLDNIVSKAKANWQAKVERDYMPKTEYEILNHKHNELLSSVSKNTMKTEFLKRNGNEEAFEDFYNLSKEHLSSVDEKDLDKAFEDLSKTKTWAFNKEATKEEAPLTKNSNDPIVKQMLGKDDTTLNDELYEGTIYKIQN